MVKTDGPGCPMRIENKIATMTVINVVGTLMLSIYVNKAEYKAGQSLTIGQGR